MRRKCRDCRGKGTWVQYTSVYHIKMTHNCNRCGGSGLDPLNYEDVKLKDGLLGLTKICSKKIKEIKGYVISNQFGWYAFRMTGIELEDGSILHCSGEHSKAFILSPTLKFNDLVMYNLHSDSNNPHQHKTWKTVIDEKKQK